VNTLCESEVLAHKIIDGPETANIEAVLSIKPVNIGEFVLLRRDGLFWTNVVWNIVELEEEGVRISLTIVDTPGFGDNIDNEHTFALFFVYVVWLVTLMHFAASRRL
jgi:cell division control protein 11